MFRGPVALALVALVLPFEASANSFGQCAQHTNPELKIIACTEASRSTPYPSILHWVYRELARAHQERGEIKLARNAYAKSLAAREHEGVRREMVELTRVSDPMPGARLAAPVVVENQPPPATHSAASIDISALTLKSDFTVFMDRGMSEEVRRAALRRLWAVIDLPVSCHDLCYEPEPAAPAFAHVASEQQPIPSQ